MVRRERPKMAKEAGEQNERPTARRRGLFKLGLLAKFRPRPGGVGTHPGEEVDHQTKNEAALARARQPRAPRVPDGKGAVAAGPDTPRALDEESSSYDSLLLDEAELAAEARPPPPPGPCPPPKSICRTCPA